MSEFIIEMGKGAVIVLLALLVFALLTVWLFVGLILIPLAHVIPLPVEINGKPVRPFWQRPND